MLSHSNPSVMFSFNLSAHYFIIYQLHQGLTLQMNHDIFYYSIGQLHIDYQLQTAEFIHFSLIMLISMQDNQVKNCLFMDFWVFGIKQIFISFLLLSFLNEIGFQAQLFYVNQKGNREQALVYSYQIMILVLNQDSKTSNLNIQLTVIMMLNHEHSNIYSIRNFKKNISLELSMHQQNKYDKKLSMMYIEQAFHHTIEVTNVSMMYKLNVKINKPIVLILNSISVIQHIIQHKDCMQLILNIQTLIQINVIVAGYGIFNQKYQLQQISKFFKTALSMNITSFDSIKKVCLQFPGWRSLTKPVLKNIMNFVRKCKFLQQFKLNLSHCVNLSKQTSDLEYQDTYYGPLCFKNQQFQALLNQICCITSDVFHKMELNFSGWESISKQFFQILIHYLSVINVNLRTLAEFNLNLNTWASSKSSQNILQNSIIDKFFKSFEDMNSLQLLQLDLRNWAQKFRVNRFKERLQQVAGGAKKQQNTSTMYMFSATGTYFGSQLRNKFNNLRVQIVE